MTSTQIQHRILMQLSYGPANMFEIAEAIDQAPFRVRAELRALKRDRLVKGIIDSTHYVWEITDSGQRNLWTDRQSRLA